jgi:hypothetical protein
MKKARSSFDECYGSDSPASGITAIQAFENDDPAPTGLLDRHGNKLYRTKETIKFGFTP